MGSTRNCIVEIIRIEGGIFALVKSFHIGEETGLHSARKTCGPLPTVEFP